MEFPLSRECVLEEKQSSLKSHFKIFRDVREGNLARRE